MERKELLVAVLIGVLVITVALQTLQLTGLSKSQLSVPLKTAAAPAAGGKSPAPAAVPTSLQNLPSMVGGC